LEKNKKIYFVSDAHLGLPNHEKSIVREKLLVKWLNEIRKDAEEIYLLGDIFDYWYEYKRVVPRGFTRFLGTISEIVDSGIPVHFFTGNHDIWVFDYLHQETGMTIHRKPVTKIFNNNKFYLAHGDALGPYDKGYKILKKIFVNKILQWFYSRIHPNFSIGLAHMWSHNRRYSEKRTIESYQGDDKEWLFLYSKSILEKEHFDYFIYGHRHIPIVKEIQDTSTFVYLGDWISNFTYAVYDGNKLELLKFD
jgi:UDP-2,3-diacylglucosamine hydrolase